MQKRASSSRRFQIGERIRVTSVPESVMTMPRSMRDGPEGTLTAFRYIIARRYAYKIVEVDEIQGWPWIAFRIRQPNGKIVHHKLMIEPECVRRVLHKA